MVRKIFFTLAIVLPLIIVLASTRWVHALWAFLIVGPLIIVGLHDVLQHTHSLLRI